jgi:hypothetical protein
MGQWGSGSVPKCHGIRNTDFKHRCLDCVVCWCRDRIPCRSSCRPLSERRSSSFSPSRRAARGQYPFSSLALLSSRNLSLAFVEISWSSSLDRRVPVHIKCVLIDQVRPSVVDPDWVGSASFCRIRIGINVRHMKEFMNHTFFQKI